MLQSSTGVRIRNLISRQFQCCVVCDRPARERPQYRSLGPLRNEPALQPSLSLASVCVFFTCPSLHSRVTQNSEPHPPRRVRFAGMAWSVLHCFSRNVDRNVYELECLSRWRQSEARSARPSVRIVLIEVNSDASLVSFSQLTDHHHPGPVVRLPAGTRPSCRSDPAEDRRDGRQSVPDRCRRT